MLKKIFGVATVCVAFGATELKADFEKDLQKVCERHKVDPKKVSILLGSYKYLYRDFKREVMEKMRKLHNFRLKEKKIIDDGRVSYFGEGGIELLKFAEWLWSWIGYYERKAKEETCVWDALKMACYNTFVQRTCNLGFACIRFQAGRFTSGKMLFDENNIEKGGREMIDDILKPLHTCLKRRVKEAILDDSYEKFYTRYCRLIDAFGEETDPSPTLNAYYSIYSMIQTVCCGALKCIEIDCRNLKELSDKDLGRISEFLKNAKDDPDAMCKRGELHKGVRKEIDSLINKKGVLSYELNHYKRRLKKMPKWKKQLQEMTSNIVYREGGMIKSATVKDHKFYDKAVRVRHEYNDACWNCPQEIEKLKGQISETMSKFSELKEKMPVEGFIEDIFRFREYNACFRLFFYCCTLFQNGLSKCFIKKNDSPDTFKEEYDSIVEIFTKKRCNSFDGAINGLRKSGNVLHAGKVVTKESFLNMEKKEGKTALFDTKFVLYDEEFESINQIDSGNKSASK